MSLFDLQPGDTVIAAKDIFNDGSHPSPDDLLVKKGTRGVVVNIGYLENQDDKMVFLIKFEDEKLELGNAVGCWESDIKTLVMS